MLSNSFLMPDINNGGYLNLELKLSGDSLLSIKKFCVEWDRGQRHFYWFVLAQFSFE